MKKYLLIPFLFSCITISAQIPEDVLKYAFFPQSGTARSLSIGGAMGSLGGDITANSVNPAGIGNFKTGEFVFTPAYFLRNNKTDFRDTKSMNSKNNFSFSNIGLVWGEADRNDPRTSQALSFTVSQVASFSNTVYYKGYNNYSSFSEQAAEDAIRELRNGNSIDGILSNPLYAYSTAPALYTYLVDTFRVNDSTVVVKALPEFVLESGKALLQEKTIATSGSIYELSLGYAYNKKDKLLIGGSVGVPIVNYRNTTTFRETDTSSDVHNNFGYSNFVDDYTTKGAGVNLKLGVIYKPKEYIRLGLAIHTPTYMITLKDKRVTNLETNTEDYNQFKNVSSTAFTNNQPGESKYSMLTPWKVLISGSYVFREIEDVRKQKGFITADIEYVGYKNTGFYSANEDAPADEQNYFKGLNKVIRAEYKNNFNFRVGGELKFNIIMARLGFAYYSNPYKNPDDNTIKLKASKMLLSGGLGYRNKGFFIDLTYVHSINKDVDFAYRLQDKSNTFATVDTRRGNIVATFGLKF